MSPILVRPIREQFEHDRVIRVLQLRLRRRFAVRVNIGDEPEATAVRSSAGQLFPDLVLTAAEGIRRLHGVVEVETTESVNRLEAMHEWVQLSKVRGAFYLYVPAGTTDVARRLCESFRVAVNEIWSYHAVGDQIRFTMVHRSKRPTRSAGSASSRTVGGKGKVAKRPARKKKTTNVRKTKSAKQGAAKESKAAGPSTKSRTSSGAKTSKKATTVRARKPGAVAGSSTRGGGGGRRVAKKAKAVTVKSRAGSTRRFVSTKTVKTRARKRR